MDASSFRTSSLGTNLWGNQICRILAAAINAVEPKEAIHRHLIRAGNQLGLAGQSYDLDEFQQILVIGAGKAGTPMAEAVEEIFPDRQLDGLVIIKEGHGSTKLPSISRRIKMVEASHPLPDQRGVDGTGKIIGLLEQTRQETLVICLLSGGGSALFVSPVNGITLSDLQPLTAELLACGASINEINTLRKHLDQVKGGKLARVSAPSPMITLILSDVVADPLDVIASGPTVPDLSSYHDAVRIIEKYQIRDRIPQSINTHLQRGLEGFIPENPGPADPAFQNVQNVIIGSNQQAAQAALDQARAEGLNAILLTSYLQGEARQAGCFVAALARQIAKDGQPLPRPACVILGGETTVTIVGNGKGGRNQELALGAVQDLAGLPDVVLISLATDGGDGPTHAAGAVVTGDTLARAHQGHLDPQEYLACNNAFPFFEHLDDLIITGPTQTNVNDLVFLFVF